MFVIRYRVRGKKDIMISGTEVRSSVCVKYMGLEGSRITGGQGKSSRSRVVLGSNETRQLQVKSRRARCKNPNASGVLHNFGVLRCKLDAGRQLNIEMLNTPRIFSL